MPSNGYLRLERAVFSHPFWMEERVFSRAEALLDLLQLAAYADHQTHVLGRIIDIPRGGIAISVRFLERRWGWSNTTVCKFLAILKKEGALTTEKRQGITIALLRDVERVNPSYQPTTRVEKRHENDEETSAARRGNDEGETIQEGKQGDVSTKLKGWIAPTLAQVVEAGEAMGCPREESQRFWSHFQANGWVNKHNQPIKSWVDRLALWWSDCKRNGKKHYGTEQFAPAAATDVSRARKREREFDEPVRPPPILKPQA